MCLGGPALVAPAQWGVTGGVAALGSNGRVVVHERRRGCRKEDSIAMESRSSAALSKARRTFILECSALEIGGATGGDQERAGCATARTVRSV